MLVNSGLHSCMSLLYQQCIRDILLGLLGHLFLFFHVLLFTTPSSIGSTNPASPSFLSYGFVYLSPFFTLIFTLTDSNTLQRN